ncbi:RHS repeat-associated core domain-containing protein [Burkholderia ubonensis]|uniref:RHS repeat-associated core domain-containing protein n=1 Tax=Burkholderia ubonensis TaxID=101571 RepID=UPI00075A7647|nr:RHS repeat-associated core domain-containing protein [Burkholderia ubonensis]KVT53811.1 hypothetical protein WK54_18170 [Burkholderia ubonensis]
MATTTVSDPATAQRCRDTPTLSVFDNRGLQVRTVRYNRTWGEGELDELITQQSYSARGHLVSGIDPRLFDAQHVYAAVQPNFRFVHSLSGQPLAIQSQDAGERVQLPDAEGGIIWQNDSRHQQSRRSYDTLHRLVTVTVQGEDGASRVSERLIYGAADAPLEANVRGQLLRGYSSAGLSVTPSYTITGQVLACEQQFLRDDLLDSNWVGDDPAAWARDFAPDAYITRWAYNALGQELERLDARGNRQRQRFNVASQLAGSELQLADQATWQPLLRAISYSAAGQVLREEAGNGVVTDYTYEPQTQRLAELRTTRPTKAGRPTVLQALSYQYDPIGNPLAIEDAAKATRYTRNQRVAPASHYTYDALYQLTQATGRENANAERQSHRLPAPIVPLFQEISALTNYTRTYTYDRGANLTAIHHQGATSSYTQRMVVAPTSNRAVPQSDGLTSGDVNGYFDACGNLNELDSGQSLAWDSRNQLQRTTQIVRHGAEDDHERYWYDSAGQRATKLSFVRTSGTTRNERVRYLPGLELRQTEQTRAGEEGATPVELLEVLTLGAAGRQSVRVLHWELGRPETIENDLLRYSLNDQIGSSVIELDVQAHILSWEEYYPYGGTAVWSAASDIEAKYKYVRYSGQERDATGLFYYGLRYYAPWLARWINPDPAGPVDGLNLFCMVGNNPVTRKDVGGLAREEEQPLLQPLTQDARNSLGNLASGAWGGIRRTGRQIRAQFIPSERSEPYVVFDNGVYASTTEQVEVRSSGVSLIARTLRTRLSSALTSLILRPRERTPETIPLLDIAPETSPRPIYTAHRPAESERTVRPRSAGYSRLSEPPSSRLAEEAARLLNPRPASPSGQVAGIELNTLSRATASWDETLSRARQIVGQAPVTLNSNEFELVPSADIDEINVMLGEMEALNIAEALYRITSEGSTSLLESELETTPLIGEERARSRMDPWSFVSFAWWVSPFLSSAFAFSFFGFSWAINARRSGL